MSNLDQRPAAVEPHHGSRPRGAVRYRPAAPLPLMVACRGTRCRKSGHDALPGEAPAYPGHHYPRRVPA
jgi:hypothetical protein